MAADIGVGHRAEKVVDIVAEHGDETPADTVETMVTLDVFHWALLLQVARVGVVVELRHEVFVWLSNEYWQSIRLDLWAILRQRETLPGMLAMSYQCCCARYCQIVVRHLVVLG